MLLLILYIIWTILALPIIIGYCIQGKYVHFTFDGSGRAKSTKFPDGNRIWYLNGQVHREDGPAVEWAHGGKSWYLYNKYLPCKTQEEFERYIKLKGFW